ncbi:MAG: hypothetical protein JXA30_16430 [Deltaproteobacteria bacterium]|nr:hypothetical protein [Deltaproteobacteria bacterium]
MKPLSYFIYTSAVISAAVGIVSAQEKDAGEVNDEPVQTEPSSGSEQAQANDPEQNQDLQVAGSESGVTVEPESRSADAVAEPEIEGASRHNAETAGVADKFEEVSREGAPADALEPLPWFSGLRTPEPPVFVLFQLSPSEIQKPSASRPLAFSFARGLTSFDGVILPLNLAVDISPYWIDSHSGVDWKEYTSAGIEQLYQNLNVSIGSSTVGDNYDDYTSLAFGVRTGIDGRDYSCEQLEPLFYRYNDELSREKLRAMDAAMSNGGQLQSFEETDADFKKKWLQQRANASALKQATEQCTRKRDWALDFAFATAFVIPDRRMKDTELSALAGWLTFGILGDTFSLVPMARVRSDLLYLDDSRTLIDLGAQVVAAVNRFAFTAEFIYRHVVDKPEDNDETSFYRTGLGIEAALSNEIWLSVGFGKKYADLVPDEDLYVMTSLRLDLGERDLGIDPESVGVEYRE